ncbi:uncharacterized protein G2W53_023134 [Senna tora]|uniref:Uncharacterized protein n=1 Tax=Senna tora TaxID=362788 RepID=A0A834WJ38_9FABA|nr:uncharacterized protein G2W53_023134 [Senna tora]
MKWSIERERARHRICGKEHAEGREDEKIVVKKKITC